MHVDLYLVAKLNLPLLHALPEQCLEALLLQILRKIPSSRLLVLSPQIPLLSHLSSFVILYYYTTLNIFSKSVPVLWRSAGLLYFGYVTKGDTFL